MTNHAPQSVSAEAGGIIAGPVTLIQGNDNRVGLPLTLPLTRFTGPAARRRQGSGEGFTAAGDREADVLNARYGLVAFVGRTEELTSLRSWLDDPRDVLVRVLVGAGGRGKTRLARELVLREAGPGWTAGFVSHGDLIRFCAAADLAAWQPPGNCLVVVDYAAMAADALHIWLEYLVRREPSGAGDRAKLRILCLERRAAVVRGWWARAFGTGGGDADAIRDLLSPESPLELKRVRSPAERRQVFIAALARAAGGTPDVADAAKIDGEGNEIDRRLGTRSWGGEPLFLAMCGVQAARLGVAEALELPADDLALTLAERELRLVQDAASPTRAANAERAFAAHIAAVATLQGGIERAQLATTLEQEKFSHSGYERIDLIAMTELLRDVIAAQDGGLAPVEPDILGEALLIRAWHDQPDAQGAVLRAFNRRPIPTLETLIRCCQDFAFLASSQPKDWLRAVIDSVTNVEILRDIYNRLPVDTVPLRDLADVVLSRIGEDIASTPEPDHDDIYDQAVTNLNRSNHLAELGRYPEALDCARRAVAMLKGLVDVAPSSRFCLELAHAQQCLANALWHMQDFRASVRESCRAIRLNRTHAEDGADFAGSLVNLSNSLADLGRPRMALRCIETAVSVALKLARMAAETANAETDAGTDFLALALNNHALRLSDLGQHAAAVQAAEYSVSLRRDRSDETPGAAVDDLATSLHNLAMCRARAEHLDDALTAIDEAIKFRRSLAALTLPVHEAALLRSLRLRTEVLRLMRSASCLASIEEELRAIGNFVVGGVVPPPPVLDNALRRYAEICGEYDFSPDSSLTDPITAAIARAESC